MKVSEQRIPNSTPKVKAVIDVIEAWFEGAKHELNFLAIQTSLSGAVGIFLDRIGDINNVPRPKYPDTGLPYNDHDYKLAIEAAIGYLTGTSGVRNLYKILNNPVLKGLWGYSDFIIQHYNLSTPVDSDFPVAYLYIYLYGTRQLVVLEHMTCFILEKLHNLNSINVGLFFNDKRRLAYYDFPENKDPRDQHKNTMPIRMGTVSVTSAKNCPVVNRFLSKDYQLLIYNKQQGNDYLYSEIYFTDLEDKHHYLTFEG